MPKQPVPGKTWYQSDSSWKYVIISINSKLKTRRKNYKELVVIEATQLSGRDKNKAKQYRNYYAKGIGFVGGIVNGELIAYLDEME
jgi:hypothetical protein